MTALMYSKNSLAADVKRNREETRVSATESQTGRFRQRRRTRSAIVNAAAELLRSGTTTPELGAVPGRRPPPRRARSVPGAPDFPRLTFSQYSPTAKHLLLAATLGL